MISKYYEVFYWIKGEEELKTKIVKANSKFEEKTVFKRCFTQKRQPDIIIMNVLLKKEGEDKQ